MAEADGIGQHLSGSSRCRRARWGVDLCAYGQACARRKRVAERDRAGARRVRGLECAAVADRQSGRAGGRADIDTAGCHTAAVNKHAAAGDPEVVDGLDAGSGQAKRSCARLRPCGASEIDAPGEPKRDAGACRNFRLRADLGGKQATGVKALRDRQLRAACAKVQAARGIAEIGVGADLDRAAQKLGSAEVGVGAGQAQQAGAGFLQASSACNLPCQTNCGVSADLDCAGAGQGDGAGAVEGVCGRKRATVEGETTGERAEIAVGRDLKSAARNHRAPGIAVVAGKRQRAGAVLH